MYLSVETSTLKGSMAILSMDGESIASANWEKDNSKGRGSHSEVITSHFQDLLTKAKKESSQLKGLIISIGPGSFTGLRVGANFVKTLSYSLNLPIYAVDSLWARTCSVSKDQLENTERPLVVMSNAFKNMVFMASYQYQESQWQEMTSPQAIKITDLDAAMPDSCFCIGDAWEIYSPFFSENLKENIHFIPHFDFPEALAIGKSTIPYLSSLPTYDWNTLRPLYIKESSAEEKMKENKA